MTKTAYILLAIQFVLTLVLTGTVVWDRYAARENFRGINQDLYKIKTDMKDFKKVVSELNYFHGEP